MCYFLCTYAYQHLLGRESKRTVVHVVQYRTSQVKFGVLLQALMSFCFVCAHDAPIAGNKDMCSGRRKFNASSQDSISGVRGLPKPLSSLYLNVATTTSPCLAQLWPKTSLKVFKELGLNLRDLEPTPLPF